MTITATAHVPTREASRYLQQLCKHWSHKLDVSFSPEQGRVVFPANGRSGNWPDDGVLMLTAQSDSLDCTLDASTDAQLEALKGVVESHLDRFAFREAPLAFDWRA